MTKPNTTLRHETITMPGIPLKPDAVFPSMRSVRLGTPQANSLGEDDELFIGYGREANALPYTKQDCYGTQFQTMQLKAIILENKFLKATFTPEVGGKLWALYDKQAKRELLTNNPVFKPQNFAIRNAWLAGGVEWNIGRTGHHDLTCSPLFTAVTEDDDGTPVLRMYEFCRSRAVSYQIDAFLPEDSKHLYIRVRIMNDRPYVIPMYWWSNIAVPEREKQRIIVPAKDSYSHSYVQVASQGTTKIKLPDGDGYDCTIPFNYNRSHDQFFNIPKGERKFEASIYGDGYGIIHTSTDRLQGRKLFVWGRGPGGLRWQRCLTDETAEGYVEIQAGLCKTQYESIPMPPRTAWEWLEAYGPIQTDPDKIFGDWDGAVEEVATILQNDLPRHRLDEILQRTSESFAKKPAKKLTDGSGWGALERLRASTPFSNHLDFGEIQEPQQDWANLLELGFLPDRDPSQPPPSYIVQDEWFEKLKNTVNQADYANWHALLQLGINYFYRFEYERAESTLKQSLQANDTPWALYALANVYRMTNRTKQAAYTMAKAVARQNNDETLAKETLLTFSEIEDFQGLATTYKLLSAELQKIPYCVMLYTRALVKLGQLDEAENLLLGDGGLHVPDIREGENSMSDLYIAIQVGKAKRLGITLDPKSVKVPAIFDYRMH